MTEIFRLRFSKLTATLWLALAAMTVQAAPQQDKEDPDRERYISELRNYKHDFLTRELDLSREQQRDFFPLYDEMEDRVMKINDDIRKIERKIENSDNASEIEIESAAQVIFSQKLREGETEMEYYPKFKEILDNRQLLRLKNTERKFTQRLVRPHRRNSRPPRQTSSPTGDKK